MILDHELLTLAADALGALTEHGTGNLSLSGLVIYVLLREGVPFYKRKRNHNPGNSNVADRLLTCEKALGKVKEFTDRADERWKAQAKFNDRMEEHVKVIHARLDKLQGA
ncbi:MAG: hypothetical protein V3S55_13825 [Nitrospiraceae bacterium]